MSRWMIARGVALPAMLKCSFETKASHLWRVDVWIDLGNRNLVNALVSYPPVMSLIPSESYSFPDDFMATVVPVRRSTKQEAEPATVEQREKKQGIWPFADPSPQATPE